MVFYIKLSEFCNIGCDHCFLPRNVREDKTVMSKEVLNRSLTELASICEHEGYKEVCVVWHGGEPLLNNISFFEEQVVYVQAFFSKLGIDVFNSLQTSLIPLNIDWIGVIKNHFEGNIGVSVDFATRKINGDSEKYLRVMDKRLRLCKDEGLSVSSNTVITRRDLNAHKDMLQWFIERGIWWFDFSRYNDFCNNSLLKPTNREYSIFLSDVLDLLIEMDAGGLKTPYIDTLVAAINVSISKQSAGTWGGGCIKTSYVVTPKGVTNFCPDRISHEDSYSSEREFSKSKFLMRAYGDYIYRSSDLVCRGCEYLSACKTGCPIESNSVIENGDCSGYKALLDYINKLYKSSDVAKSYIDKVISFERLTIVDCQD